MYKVNYKFEFHGGTQYINFSNKDSILYFLDSLITILICLCDKKKVFVQGTNYILNYIICDTENWIKCYKSEFIEFMIDIDEMFMYKSKSPFKHINTLIDNKMFIKNNLTPLNNVLTDYIIEFNYKYFDNLDDEFVFPNINNIIYTVVHKYSHHIPVLDYKFRYLYLCNIPEPLINFDENKKIKSENITLKSENITLKEKIQIITHNNVQMANDIEHIHNKNIQLETNVSMLTSFIADIHKTSIEDPIRLTEKIKEINDIVLALTIINEKKRKADDIPCYD